MVAMEVAAAKATEDPSAGRARMKERTTASQTVGAQESAFSLSYAAFSSLVRVGDPVLESTRSNQCGMPPSPERREEPEPVSAYPTHSTHLQSAA